MPKVTMPQLGESVAEGTIGKWLKKVGDHVDKYEPIVEVITDKVNAEVPSPYEGTLSQILVQEGDTVPNNTEIAVIDGAGDAATPEPTVLGTGGHGPAGSDERAEPGAAPPAAPPPVTASPPPPAPASAPTQAPVMVASADDGATNGASAVDTYTGRMTPAVRRLAREHSVDLSMIAGSGHSGRVTREDVMRFVESGGASAAATAPASGAVPTQPSAPPPPPPGPSAVPAAMAATAPEPSGLPSKDELKPITPMRKAIAKHMSESKSNVPHAYTTVEVDMSGVVALRESVKKAYQTREGVALSFVAIIGKAVVESLRRNPDLNSHWTAEGLLRKANINLGIAVAVDDGLVVPVIHDADRYSIHGLNLFVSDLSTRARSNKLKLEDVQGGTFTLNNTGWFGSVSSQPIVNVPEVAILSMEAIVKRPVVIETANGDTIGIRPIMNLSTSFDHRATDGAQIGKFVADVKRWLEAVDPQTPVW